jgi:hypothetical protein
MFIVGTNNLNKRKSANRFQHLEMRPFVGSINLRSICEQIIHLLERPSLRLRLERPEVQRIREVAHDEKQVKAPANAFHGDWRHLTDHGVESEGDHDSDRDAFAAGFGVEDFGGDDPW